MGARSGGGAAGWTSGQKAAFKALTSKSGAYKYSKSKAAKIVNANKQYYGNDNATEDIPF